MLLNPRLPVTSYGLSTSSCREAPSSAPLGRSKVRYKHWGGRLRRYLSSLALFPRVLFCVSSGRQAFSSSAGRSFLTGSGRVVDSHVSLRFCLPEDSKVPLLLSTLGVVVIGFVGWLGGEMVYVKGMAVQAGGGVTKGEEDCKGG